MLTVHHLNNSRSQRVLWLLEELGVRYEIARYQRQPNMLAPPELRAIHPLGKSPVITDTGNTVAVSALLRLAGECELVTTVLDRHGAILCLGRTQRLASRAQRRALAARDGGCCFPGCTRPASWCQVHHVISWLDGGPTDLDNLVLLCGYHHRCFERLGWTVRMAHGAPEWIPPPWIDPTGTPRRNTAHHLPKIKFAVPIVREPARC